MVSVAGNLSSLLSGVKLSTQPSFWESPEEEGAVHAVEVKPHLTPEVRLPGWLVMSHEP